MKASTNFKTRSSGLVVLDEGVRPSNSRESVSYARRNSSTANYSIWRWFVATRGGFTPFGRKQTIQDLKSAWRGFWPLRIVPRKKHSNYVVFSMDDEMWRPVDQSKTTVSPPRYFIWEETFCVRKQRFWAITSIETGRVYHLLRVSPDHWAQIQQWSGCCPGLLFVIVSGLFETSMHIVESSSSSYLVFIPVELDKSHIRQLGE